MVNVASIQYSVNIGNSITLQCNVQSNPLHTNVKWQKIDGNGNAVDVDMTNNRYTGSKVNSPSLIISNTISGDQGGYICLATNIVGTGQSRQTFLTVVGSKFDQCLNPNSKVFVLVYNGCHEVNLTYLNINIFSMSFWLNVHRNTAMNQI